MFSRFTDGQSIKEIEKQYIKRLLERRSPSAAKVGTDLERKWLNDRLEKNVAAEEIFGWEDNGDRPDIPNVFIGVRTPSYTYHMAGILDVSYYKYYLPLFQIGIQIIVLN